MFPFQFFQEKPGEKSVNLKPIFIEQSFVPHHESYFINIYYRFDSIDSISLDKNVNNYFKNLARQERLNNKHFEMYSILSPSRKYQSHILLSYSVIERNQQDEAKWSVQSIQVSNQLLEFINQQINEQLNSLEGFNARDGQPNR